MKKYYIEISNNNDKDNNYILQSKWYDNKKDALAFVKDIDFIDYNNYTISLMCSNWDKESNTYTDIELAEILN